MAGHETRQVRPRTPQNRQRIAAGSPLAIQGIFIEILRERFAETAGLDWIWRSDPTTTDIIIEANSNIETEVRDTVPALYITRNSSTVEKLIVGDRAGVRLKNHLEGFGALLHANMSIDCVAADEGTSAILGDVVQFTLLASQDVIQREFGFYDFQHPILGATQPTEKDKTKWSTTVAFNVSFWIRWSQVIIAPLLQQIVTNVKERGENLDNYYTTLTLNSLRRAHGRT